MREHEPNIPPEAGKHAHVDPKTGEVHGSGASAGGGNAGEDYDDDTTGGGGDLPQMGVGDTDRTVPER